MIMKERTEIGIESLVIEPFKSDIRKTFEFDCGQPSLNGFLCSDEVYNYQEQLLGKTFLVFSRGILVAYYTISAGSLRKETVDNTKSVGKILNIEEIPSVIIGRLAVDLKYQKQGIGEYLVQKIIVESIFRKDLVARLVLVQAKEEAFDFYIKCGFNFVNETRRERKRYRARGTRTMFFDLLSLRDNESFKDE
jgi:GNAT superfamily N-acetyltransferase